MSWYHYDALVALAVCLLSLSYHLFRLIRLGMPSDYSQRTGDLNSAIRYSFLGAMSPAKKESAYLHLPTYTAGVLYHLGTFISIFFFFLFICDVRVEGTAARIFIPILALTAFSGFGILVKRIVSRTLRSITSPDDYVSNILVTLFQILSLAMLVSETSPPLYFSCAALLFLYLPLGKLKHALYFFAARLHLGFFYGWRGVWPGNRQRRPA